MNIKISAPEASDKDSGTWIVFQVLDSKGAVVTVVQFDYDNSLYRVMGGSDEGYSVMDFPWQLGDWLKAGYTLKEYARHGDDIQP